MGTLRLDDGNAAYDLARFASASPRTRNKKPVLVVARPSARARAKAQTRSAMKIAMVMFAIVAMVVVTLCSYAKLTELNRQLANRCNELEEAKSEVTRLSTELEAKMSLRNIEEYATQRLGMASFDKSQITYVELSQGDKVELTEESPNKTWIDEIEEAISNVQEYI